MYMQIPFFGGTKKLKFQLVPQSFSASFLDPTTLDQDETTGLWHLADVTSPDPWGGHFHGPVVSFHYQGSLKMDVSENSGVSP